jgi:nucleoside-diphosphate-sugar epimerase
MAKRIFLAGASGAVGRRLSILLIQDGWSVVGTTRSASKSDALRAAGVEPVVVDVFDADALKTAVANAQPDIVIHQLTDLPFGLEPSKMAAARERNTHLRDTGTRNLVAAAVNAGAKRLIAQSIAFAYAPGPTPYLESSPLSPTARGPLSLEEQVLGAPLEGIVLRYGHFYGPGTGIDKPPPEGPVHVDAAADAARRALRRGSRGVYNIAEEDGTVSSAKARNELGWREDFRID